MNESKEFNLLHLTETVPERICRLKQAFSLKVKAEVEILARRNNPRHPRRASIPLYAYQCAICQQWHITKKPRGNESHGA